MVLLPSGTVYVAGDGCDGVLAKLDPDTHSMTYGLYNTNTTPL